MNIKNALKVAAVALAAMSVPAYTAYAAFWQWSKTSSVNAGADPTINWAEGMSPSSVNDSARAMMARAAEYRDDISGSLVTTGTSSAYVVSTNQGLTSPSSPVPQNGQLLAITPNVTNAAGAMLTADGGSAYPIQTSPGVAVGDATMIAGTPYSMKFSTAVNAWILRNYYGSAFSIPLGGLLQSTVATPPNSNFILPAGQCISTTTYNTYWVALGSPASGACPGGQFAVIDSRSRALVGLDNLNGTPANRLTTLATGCGTAMTTMGASCVRGDEKHLLTIAEMPSHNHPLHDPSHSHNFSASIYVGSSYYNRGDGIEPSLSVPTNPYAPAIVGNFTGVYIDAAGGGGTHSIVNPNIAVYVFLRVL